MLPGCRAFALLLLIVGACGDDGPATTDARVLDGVPLDVPDGCDPSTLYLAGELLGWDATSANPDGVAGVTVTQRGDATKTTATTAAGAFELCVTNDALVLVDIVPADGTEVVGGVALVDKDVLGGGGAYSIRTFERPRAVTDYAFDETKAHVFVRINNAPRRASLAATSDRSYAFLNDEWIGGEDTGQDLYFANVDASTGETKLVIERAVGVPSTIPLAAGQLTFVVVNATTN